MEEGRQDLYHRAGRRVTILRQTPSQVSSYLEQVPFTPEGENCFMTKKPQHGMKGHTRGGDVDKRDKKE